MSINLANISYIHPDLEPLFSNITFSVEDGEKIALIGKNGSGKSTLLKIVAGLIWPTDGEINTATTPYYIPQHFGQYEDYTIAQALGVAEKLNALHKILSGEIESRHYDLLNDEWDIEERIEYALDYWKLSQFKADHKFSSMSGGEKTRTFLAGIHIHKPEIILMDEPTNHLDFTGRELLYNYIEESRDTMILVSHDRTLLNLLDTTIELDRKGVTRYGGNYDLYKEIKDSYTESLINKIEDKQKELRVAKKVAREAIERKEKQDARGKKKQIKGGVPRIMMNTIRNRAESSNAKLKNTHGDKLSDISQELSKLRKEVPDASKIKISFENSLLHKGKTLIKAEEVNFHYGDSGDLWEEALSFRIESGERIAIKGDNGSGKSTLIKILLHELEPTSGEIFRADFTHLYADQQYSIIDNSLTLLEQVEKHNNSGAKEHEIRTLLNRFLFSKERWDIKCGKLSGGEKMRLIFCTLAVSTNTPDVIILDEPTNNLDIESLEIITSALQEYEGTLIVVSHDKYFLNEIGVEKELEFGAGR